MKWVASSNVYKDGWPSEYSLVTEAGDVIAKATSNRDGETYMVQRSKDGLVVASMVTEKWIKEWTRFAMGVME